jgi:hypothetical protein
MTSIASDDVRPARAISDMAEFQQSEEQPATQHMQGWALTFLTIAFMSICFVLAIDNTILGSYLSRAWE